MNFIALATRNVIAFKTVGNGLASKNNSNGQNIFFHVKMCHNIWTALCEEITCSISICGPLHASQVGKQREICLLYKNSKGSV